MRVIGGRYRSRTLKAPPGLETRPTSDRLRETLFNILAPRLDGCAFADLYAGTGAVGIEAISRGAAFVWFAEKARPALVSLRANLAALQLSHTCAVEERGTLALLQSLERQASQVDIVFLDPPYEAEKEYLATLSRLGSATGMGILAPGAIVVVEHASRSKFALEAQYGALSRVRQYAQGDAALSFYKATPLS